MADDQSITVNGKSYPRNPGLMDRFKEGFETTQQRAQLDAMRRAMDTMNRAKDKGYTSNIQSEDAG